MLIRHRFEGKPLEQCWAEVHPDAKLDPETARLRAAEELGWLRRNHPLRISELLLIYDLGTDALIDDLENQLIATKNIVTVKKKKGARVTVIETTEVQDNYARSLALEQLIEISRSQDPKEPLTRGHRWRPQSRSSS